MFQGFLLPRGVQDGIDFRSIFGSILGAILDRFWEGLRRPSWPQESHKTAQNAAKTPQDAPRWLQDAPRQPQGVPRWPQDAPKTPKRIQDAPRRGQDGRRQRQDGPPWPQDGSRWLKMVQDGQRWPPHGLKMAARLQMDMDVCRFAARRPPTDASRCGSLCRPPPARRCIEMWVAVPPAAARDA